MMTTPNRIDIEGFKDVLNDEIAVFDTIEALLKDKKEIIARGDLEALVKLDNQLENLTQQARDLEKERMAIMIKMGRGDDTLREFIHGIQDDEDQELLTHAREHLARTTQDIRTLSHSNQDLLTQSIRMIEQSVEVIASMLSPDGAAYTRSRGRKTAPEPIKSPQLKSTIIRDA